MKSLLMRAKWVKSPREEVQDSVNVATPEGKRSGTGDEGEGRAAEEGNHDDAIGAVILWYGAWLPFLRFP